MLDLLLDRLYLALLLVPIVIALGSAVVKWWREMGEPPTSSDRTDQGTAEVRAVGLFPDGMHHRLRLTNEGTAPAHNVHVYVNNKSVPAHRGGASAESHPLPELGPGQSFSYRYSTGRGDANDQVLVRIEWEDRSGGGMRRTVVQVP